VVLGPGETIDRYKIVRLLGTGGMGHVYEARDPRLLRSVALKVLHLDKSQRDAVGRQRLLHEARLAASLEHPNVVAIYDVGEVQRPGDDETTMYLAMELIAGRSLRSHVGDPGVPVKERVRILRDVATALAAAHARGMIHRDVKPENVMVREDGVVKVLDFGIAKRDVRPDDPPASEPAPIVPTTAEGIAVGTPYYMAPEQMRGEPLDGRADQFAWGVVAYELFAGELPWTPGSDPLQIVAQVLSRDPPLLTTKSADVPVAVAGVVMRALAKSRDHRFASMTALLEAMASEGAAPTVATERGPLAVPVSIRPPPSPTSSGALDPALAATQGAWGTPAIGGRAQARPKRRLAIGVTGALVLSVGIGALLLRRQPSPAPASPSATTTPSVQAASAVATSLPPPVTPEPSTSIATVASSAPRPARPAPPRPGHPAAAPPATTGPSSAPPPSPYDHL
jgi:eukaryotic-like serine/threonine-protein kinase